MASGDLDGDGHPEVVIVNMNEKVTLLKNQGRHQNAVLIHLNGNPSNRSGIGTRVVVEAGKLRQMDEVRSGGSFYSHNDLTLHFGVGRSVVLDRLEVRWPSGKVQEWKGLPVNQRLVTSDLSSVECRASLKTLTAGSC
jgi:hypothetical protein